MVRLVTQPTHGSDLLALYRTSGSPDVFAQIMRAYGGMVFSVCYKVTKDSADAEDAAQAAFLTLAVQCKTGSTITYLGPWLKKVAKRSALDLVRSRKRRNRREAITAESRPEFFSERPGAQAEAAELSKIIRYELDQLPAKYRMPLVLHYFGGMSHEQIAKEMACTTAALGVRLHRARKMLGKRLTAKNISLEGAALGLAIAAAVHHVVSDHFIYSTQVAVMGVNAAMVHGGPVAGLPVHLGAVTQIVSEIGQSMARARMKMAAITLVASITMLGGVAEAVHHLPESMRANLDFLAPSQILQNLIRAFSPSPEFRMRAEAPKKVESKVVVAAAVEVSHDAVSAPAAIAPLPSPMVLVNQPILALQVPPILPPISGGLALPKFTSTFTNTNFTPSKTVTLSAAPTTNDDPIPAHRSDSTSFHLMSASSGGGSSHSDSSSIDAPSSGGGHRGDVEITQNIPQPDAFGRGTDNLTAPSTIGPFESVAFSGSITGQATTTKNHNAIGPVQITSDAAGFTPDSVVLQSNQVFVHSGNGKYHWAAPSAGITIGGTNSADFSLDGAVGDGVVTINRLPVTTTLAPVRPTGHHFVGIWSLDSTVDYSKITLTAHYDESFAEALGLDEKILKLWVYDNNQWIRIMDSSFSRNLIDHSLTGTYDGMPTFFAVSAPEPASVMFIFGASAVTMLRRRRSKIG